MTKKDFQLIADAIKAARAELLRDGAHDGPILSTREWDYIFGRVADNVARALRGTNPRFDAQRFADACK